MSSVTVEINGKETVSKAAQEAGKGISGLSQEAKNAQSAASGLSSETSKLNGVFGGFVITAGDVVNAVKSIASAAMETINQYTIWEKAQTQFSSAMVLSGKITSDQAKGLHDLSQELEALTGVDGEAILSMEAFLASSGRNEAQIRKLITAAADYSAATGKDMRTAVEELNKTFSGSEGRIGMLIPALKDLTEEELKNGKGIDIVAAQYRGWASGMQNTADVTLKNVKLAWEDVLAALGAEIFPKIQPALEEVTKFMREKLIPGIGDFFDVTVAIFENFPIVAKRTFMLINDIVRRTFSWEGISDILIVLGRNIENTFLSAISLVPQIFLGMVSLMFEPVRQLGLYIADTITKAFSGKGALIQSPGDLFANILKGEETAIGKIVENTMALFNERVSSTINIAGGIGNELYAGLFGAFGNDIEKIIKPTLDRLTAAGIVPPLAGGSSGSSSTNPGAGNPPGSYLGTSAGVGSGLSGEWAIPKYYEPDTENGPSDYTVKFGNELSTTITDLTNTLKVLNISAEDYAFSLTQDTSGADARRKSSQYGSMWARQEASGGGPILGGYSDLRGGAASFASGKTGADMSHLQGPSGQSFDWLTTLGQAIMPVVNGFLGMITPLASVQAILNPLQTIFSAMMDVLGPLINTILAPIVGILRVIGTTIGAVLAPILSALAPIINAIAMGFVWLYNNAIVPFANMLILAGNWLYNGVVKIVNFLLGWLGVQMTEISLSNGQLSTIYLSSLATTGTTSYSGTSGASATYQKPRDITVNNYLNVGQMVGEDGFHQFCLMVGMELRSSGVLGQT